MVEDDILSGLTSKSDGPPVGSKSVADAVANLISIVVKDESYTSSQKRKVASTLVGMLDDLGVNDDPGELEAYDKAEQARRGLLSPEERAEESVRWINARVAARGPVDTPGRRRVTSLREAKRHTLTVADLLGRGGA